jgi:hypothetical protein
VALLDNRGHRHGQQLVGARVAELLGLAHGSAADVDDPEFVVEEEAGGVVLGRSVGVDAGEPAPRRWPSR